jgi:hypothetical protein
MSSFPPIHAIPGVQYNPTPEVTTTSKDVIRVYDDKVVTTTAEYITYDKGGSVKTVTNTSQMVDLLI